MKQLGGRCQIRLSCEWARCGIMCLHHILSLLLLRSRGDLLRQVDNDQPPVPRVPRRTETNLCRQVQPSVRLRGDCGVEMTILSSSVDGPQPYSKARIMEVSCKPRKETPRISETCKRSRQFELGHFTWTGQFYPPTISFQNVVPLHAYAEIQNLAQVLLTQTRAASFQFFILAQVQLEALNLSGTMMLINHSQCWPTFWTV